VFSRFKLDLRERHVVPVLRAAENNKGRLGATSFETALKLRLEESMFKAGESMALGPVWNY
jgi:hypothetical protein